jgi:hypothetical protein
MVEQKCSKLSSRCERMPANQFNSQASLSLPFCASPVSRPVDSRRTTPRGPPQLRRKEPGCLTTVCVSYAHYRWLVHPDVKRFFHIPRDLPHRRPRTCSTLPVFEDGAWNEQIPCFPP